MPSGLGNDALEEFEKVDREGVIRILKENNSVIPFETVKHLREDEPETIARHFSETLRARGWPAMALARSRVFCSSSCPPEAAQGSGFR